MIDPLSRNEVPGDSVTHMMKSGSIIRMDGASQYSDFVKKIPKKFQNLNVSYDVWWDGKDSVDKATNRPNITGFCYTDFLTKGMLFKPANSILAEGILETILNNQSDQIKPEIVELFTSSLEDKYMLSDPNVSYDRVIFLPGTNILENIVDMDRVKTLVDEEGAMIKPHPLTSKYHILMLKHRFGESSIIDSKASGNAILKNAKVVFCCTNSEMGLVALLLGKSFCIINNKKQIRSATYESIYSSIMKNSKQSPHHNLCKLISSDFSGIIHVDDPEAETKMYNFLNSFNFFVKVIAT